MQKFYCLYYNVGAAFRTSRVFKALDKHDVTTPTQVRDLLAAGDDATLVDTSTGNLVLII